MLLHFGVQAEPGTSFQYSSLMQPKKKAQSGNFDKSRVLIGPGLGFGAAYRAFSFNISPSLGYALTDNFITGFTLGFNYLQTTEEYYNFVTQRTELFKHKYPAYSMSIFARYLISNFLIVNFEPEINNTKFVNNYTINTTTGKIVEDKTRLFVPSVLVGVGYMQRFNRYSHSYLMICYDLVQNPNARYFRTLDYRAGIMLSLWP
jgi:hypothetical protein